VIPIPVQLSTRFAYYNRVGEEKRVFDNSVKYDWLALKRNHLEIKHVEDISV